MWISYPSSVRAGGAPKMPALSIRMSRRDAVERNFLAAFLMESKDPRSSSRKLIDTYGTCVLISEITAFAFAALRAVTQSSDGLCFASSKAECLPRPEVLPVMSMTLSLREGMSLSELKDVLLEAIVTRGKSRLSIGKVCTCPKKESQDSAVFCSPGWFYICQVRDTNGKSVPRRHSHVACGSQS